MKKILGVFLFLLVAFTLVTMASAESGDAFSMVKGIVVNKNYTDKIDNSEEVDWYKFNIDNSGYICIDFYRDIDVSLTYEQSSYGYWNAVLYNSKLEEISSYSFSQNEIKTETYKVGLESGLYYLKFCKGYKFVDVDYTFNIKYVSTPYWEKELNDDYKTANNISLNTILSGSINDYDDMDWYKFNIDDPGYVYIDFNRDIDVSLTYEQSAYSYWNAVLYNSDLKEISSYSFSQDEIKTETYKVGLDSGLYYLKFYRGYKSVDVDYVFNIKYSSTLYWEKELNDDYKTANNISINTIYGGSINDYDDMDWYVFNVKNSDNFNFSFQHSYGDSSFSAWCLTLYDSTMNEIATYSFSQNIQKEVTKKINLKQGKHYIKITRGYNASNMDYSFEINSEAILDLGKTSKITATQTTNTAKLTWSAVDSANIYRVYQKNGSSWKKLVDVTNLNYTVKSLKAGTKYSFAVKAGKKADGKITWAEGYTTIATATKALKPSGVTSAQNASAIKLSWNKVSGATGYRIYYKSGDKWKVSVSATTATSHTFKNLKAGAKFTFAIRPYIKTDSGVVWSDYTTFKASTVPSNPTLKVTAPSKGKLTVNWKAVNGAEGYQLWYKTGNGSYKLYKTYSKAGTLNFSNLKSGTKYTFAVRAVIKTDGGNVRSGYKAVSTTVK